MRSSSSDSSNNWFAGVQKMRMSTSTLILVALVSLASFEDVYCIHHMDEEDQQRLTTTGGGGLQVSPTHSPQTIRSVNFAVRATGQPTPSQWATGRSDPLDRLRNLMKNPSLFGSAGGSADRVNLQTLQQRLTNPQREEIRSIVDQNRAIILSQSAPAPLGLNAALPDRMEKRSNWAQSLRSASWAAEPDPRDQLATERVILMLLDELKELDIGSQRPDNQLPTRLPAAQGQEEQQHHHHQQQNTFDSKVMTSYMEPINRQLIRGRLIVTPPFVSSNSDELGPQKIISAGVSDGASESNGLPKRTPSRRCGWFNAITCF